jgi:phosphopantothenoylcysteine decarboxylase/phosphopantothenate--cysteine ligase
MNDMPLSQRNIVLGITGSVAAYKACIILRRLREAGAQVRVIMTQAATHFVGVETLASLSGNRVITGLFESSEQWVPDHISLSRWAHLILVAPATANIIGKAAAGIADDSLSTTILSARCKLLFAPAMNSTMYDNPVVQDNIARLRRIGCEFIPAEAGPLACGEEGVGRLAEPKTILDKVISILRTAS